MNIKKQKGFTLIELLVVIAIIGILSAVVLASLNTARQKARDAQRVSDVRQVQLALEFYFDEYRQYIPSNATGIGIPGGLSPTYIPAIPLQPAGSTPYGYGTPVGNALYCLGATLEDPSPLPGNNVPTCIVGTAGAVAHAIPNTYNYAVAP